MKKERILLSCSKKDKPIKLKILTLKKKEFFFLIVKMYTVKFLNFKCMIWKPDFNCRIGGYGSFNSKYLTVDKHFFFILKEIDKVIEFNVICYMRWFSAEYLMRLTENRAMNCWKFCFNWLNQCIIYLWFVQVNWVEYIL